MITDKSGQYSEEGVDTRTRTQEPAANGGTVSTEAHCEALGSASCKVSAVGEQS